MSVLWALITSNYKDAEDTDRCSLLSTPNCDCTVLIAYYHFSSVVGPYDFSNFVLALKGGCLLCEFFTTHLTNIIYSDFSLIITCWKQIVFYRIKHKTSNSRSSLWSNSGTMTRGLRLPNKNWVLPMSQVHRYGFNHLYPKWRFFFHPYLQLIQWVRDCLVRFRQWWSNVVHLGSYISYLQRLSEWSLRLHRRKLPWLLTNGPWYRPSHRNEQNRSQVELWGDWSFLHRDRWEVSKSNHPNKDKWLMKGRFYSTCAHIWNLFRHWPSPNTQGNPQQVR